MRSPSFSECKKKSRSTAMLDVAGFSLQLDDEKGEELQTEEAIERLQRLAAGSDAKAALGLSGRLLFLFFLFCIHHIIYDISCILLIELTLVIPTTMTMIY